MKGKLSKVITLIALSSGLLVTNALADEFSYGPVFSKYGKNVTIVDGLKEPEQVQLKVLFDIAKASEEGKVNRSFDTIARFINMHVRAGVPKQNIKVAMVVHSKAGFDLLNQQAYQAKFSKTNPSQELVTQLLKNNVEIYMCGQSARYMDIANSEFQKGITMSLSAMTANALLQQQGYTLNPF